MADTETTADTQPATTRPRTVDILFRDRSTAVWFGILLLLLLSSVLFGFPAPLPIAFLGAVIGSVISFISIGFVLIYRSNRIINFAQADIGAVGAILTVLLITVSQMNYFLAVPIGILTATALAGLIELAVVRRFFKSPRLILTVATIALAQLLEFIELILPGTFGRNFVAADVPTPLDVQFSIPDPRGVFPALLFDGNHLLAILAVPIVILALGAFLKYTSAGIAARASADNAERAGLLGIPVKRVSTIIWLVAGGLSALGAILRAPTLGLSTTGEALGPLLLVRGLAPAVVGKMENMRTTFVAAVVLGIVDQSVFFRTSDQGLSHLILFLVILGGLLVYRREQARVGTAETSTWQTVKEVRPVPRELKRVPEVRVGFRLAGAVLLLSVVLLGLFAPNIQLDLVSLILIFGMIGVSLVLLTGWAGQISLGQFAFVAIGAAICGTLVADRGWNLLAALPIAGFVGAAVAVIVGLPALRIRGLFLAASTVAFGLFVSSMVLNPRYFGWLVPNSRVERPVVFGLDLSRERVFFFFVLAITLLTLASARSLRRTRTGRVLIGARDNERATRAFGVNVTAARLAAFALSGFYAAVAGGLYALHQNTVVATAFGVEKSLQVFVMVVIGGLGSVPGALLGATYFFVTEYYLQGAASLLATGFGMLVVLMILPGGLGQVMYGWRDSLLRWIAKRRKIVVPSLLADVRVDDSILLPGARSMEESAQAVPAGKAD
jgi:branched-chain amino acid transport system permease protein